MVLSYVRAAGNSWMSMRHVWECKASGTRVGLLYWHRDFTLVLHDSTDYTFIALQKWVRNALCLPRLMNFTYVRERYPLTSQLIQENTIIEFDTITEPCTLHGTRRCQCHPRVPSRVECAHLSISTHRELVSRRGKLRPSPLLNMMVKCSISHVARIHMVMQLRKVTFHPYLFDKVETGPPNTTDELIESSGKMVILEKLLALMKKKGSQLVYIQSDVLHLGYLRRLLSLLAIQILPYRRA
ncbi:hypothetical protein PILCRDRAFT_629046 [Piloderma croceum F 1598]|uniref:Uncharacterized protein n=1 Tax=Piloderma croceum (strain F 1598) TaxID=765440 RepID=A0A0C3ASP6_PILCF|nr:hypothetical protein PILCRDRAFT_629046 [Piloderma croceum F 1598]